jgi:hypothetical protein
MKPTKREKECAEAAGRHVTEALLSMQKAGYLAMGLSDDDCIEFNQRAGEARRVLEVLERWLARKAGKAP